MKRTIGNFLTQTNKDFPVDCELFASLQNNQTMLAILGNIAGDKAILYGCESESNDTRRKAGYVFIRTADYPEGEILFFEGGAVQSGMCIKLESVPVSSQGVAYSAAYTLRSLVPGVGEENYSWGDFHTLKTVQELDDYDKEQDKQIALLQPTPVGIVQMWAGKITGGSLPDNYLLCDGSRLLATAYPELYAAVGRIHTPLNVPSGYFCLPDLRSRFIVGYNDTDTDYNAIAKTGGEKKHTLTVSEMPSHTHTFNDYYYVEHSSAGAYWGAEYIGTNFSGSGNTDKDNSYLWYKPHTTYSSGNGSSHENRPPYYTLAFIIRVK